MPLDLLIPLVTLFGSVALGTGYMAYLLVSRSAPAQRRLRGLGSALDGAGLRNPELMETPSPMLKRMATVIPKSPKEMSRLQRRLATAGYRSFGAVILYSLSELLLPVLLGGATLWLFGIRRALIPALFVAVIAYMMPSFWLGRQVALRKKQIRNGLPDALDLMIVCLEAGSAIDQALIKVCDELEISYPALAEELRLVSTETRAGKSRLEAFKNFAERTKVDDVRAFVAMLIQTDRFGTSLAQALRTHAETARSKRRQRAEEKAAKLGVKLVFPLVFCLFPAFYVVVLGPAVIKFIRVFFGELKR